MGDGARAGSVAVLSGSWGTAYDETAFAVRSLAGAIARVTQVHVLVPQSEGELHPDGAFDLTGVGKGGGPYGWPDPGHAATLAFNDVALAIADRADPATLVMAHRLFPEVKLAVLSPADTDPAPGSAIEEDAEQDALAPSYVSLRVGVGHEDAAAQSGSSRGRSEVIGLHVPINPLAAAHPHNGVGFTGYILVLSDRVGVGNDDDDVTQLARWLVGRFPREYVIVVEQAVASVWRSRSLRGQFGVDSRADLWRLVAHARFVIDLGPGPLFGRECVEALRFGVPIVVPSTTPAAVLARQGGGLWFSDVAELLECVAAMKDPHVRDALATQGRAVADCWYSDSGRFVARVQAALFDLAE